MFVKFSINKIYSKADEVLDKTSADKCRRVSVGHQTSLDKCRRTKKFFFNSRKSGTWSHFVAVAIM